jgi:hypothetical protein
MDIQLLETGNGGDITLSGNDLVAVTGVENQPYLACFGGDANWWGNELLFNANETYKFLSETEALLTKVALTSANRLLIEAAIKRDLQFLLDNVPNSTLTVRTQIQSDNRLLMNVDFSGYEFSLLWNPNSQAAKIVPYSNPIPLLIWTTEINAYAITDFDMEFGSRTVTVPCWIYDNDTDVTARVAYLNSTFVPANGMTGSFSFVSGKVYYTNGAAENWGIDVMPRKLTRACFLFLTVAVPSGSPDDYQFTYTGAGSDMVVDWGDSTDAVFYHPTSSQTALHNYSDTSDKTVRFFHNGTLITNLTFSVFFATDYSLYRITGTLPASITSLFLASQTSYISPASVNISGLSSLATLGITGGGITSFSPALFSAAHNSLGVIVLTGNALSSTEVDAVFNTFVATTPAATVYSSTTRILNIRQTPAAAPTGASLAARTALAAAGWTLYQRF